MSVSPPMHDDSWDWADKLAAFGMAVFVFGVLVALLTGCTIRSCVEREPSHYETQYVTRVQYGYTFDGELAPVMVGNYEQVLVPGNCLRWAE